MYAAASSPSATQPTPASSTGRGPKRSIHLPRSGLSTAARMKPNEKAAAVAPRSQPNSSTIGGKSSENAVRALTPIAMVMLGGFLGVTAAEKLPLATPLMFLGVAAIIVAYLIFWSVVYYVARQW